jgi:alkanesulfonate monooxygenase
MSGWTGIDLSANDLEEQLRPTKTAAGQSALESFTVGDPNRRWKIREIAEFVGIGGRRPVAVGSPAQVADQLERWVAETDIDGFNLTYAVMPETYENIVDLLIPELQGRGIYKKNTEAEHCERSYSAEVRICRRHTLGGLLWLGRVPCSIFLFFPCRNRLHKAN